MDKCIIYPKSPTGSLPEILPISAKDIHQVFQAHDLTPSAACLQHLEEAVSMSPGAFASLKNNGGTWEPVYNLTVLFLTHILMGATLTVACSEVCEDLNAAFAD